MRLFSWLDALKPASSRRPIQRGEARARQPVGVKLFVELLEERSMPSFLGPVNYATGAYPYAVVAAHLNNDTILDLAVANYSDSTVSVLLGNGDGTFQPAVTSPTGYLPLSVAVGDFND